MQHRNRPLLLAALVACFAIPVGAQVPSTSAESAKPAGRPDRQIERIRIQDTGARIDELRVGGETLSITVQPAGDMPAYEVKPSDTSRAGSAADTSGTGSRFWNVLKF